VSENRKQGDFAWIPKAKLLLTDNPGCCLIGAEIIIMISPFALYFYSVYGPILDCWPPPDDSWLTNSSCPLVFLTISA
jgi:hypothetical protein